MSEAMADAEIPLDPGVADAVEAAEPLLSNIDFLILSMMAGFAVYWFFIRKSKQEQPTFKKLTVQ